MKNIIYIVLLVLLLTACSSDGTLKITNRTKHEIYLSIDGVDYTLSGYQNLDINSHVLEIDLATESDFLGNSGKAYVLDIEGETFALWDDFNNIVVPSTEVTINPDKTTTVFCDPDYACVRITNNSSVIVEYANYIMSNEEVPRLIGGSQNILPQQSIYYRLEYLSNLEIDPEDRFYYTFQVTMVDSTIYEFGDENNFLHKDDLYHIVIE